MGWKVLHEEQPSGAITIESWYNAEKNALLFIRNSFGKSYAVYQTIEDTAEHDIEFALAEVCYGYYNFLYEKINITGEVGASVAHDDFLDDCWERSKYFRGIEDQFTCHDNLGECEDAFHAIQVSLGNEECVGCDICTEYAKRVEDFLVAERAQ